MTKRRIVVAAMSLLAMQHALPASAQYQQNIDDWVAQDRLNPPPDNAVLFLGSSSIRLWESVTRDFAHYDVIQRGFGSARLPFLTQYVNDIVLPYDPAAIVLFSGGTEGTSPQEDFDQFLGLIDRVHTGQDQTRPPIPILVIGRTPQPGNWENWPHRRAVNSLREAHTLANDALYYVDAPVRFLATAAAPGEPPSEDLFVADRRHLNSAGYQIWREEVGSVLEQVVPPTKTYVPNPRHPPVGSRILFDFGIQHPRPGFGHTESPDENDNHWNNWHAADAGHSVLAGQSIGNLVTTEGDETGIDMAIAGEFAIGSGRLRNPDTALLGDLAIQSAVEDFFHRLDGSVEPGVLMGGLMLVGLDPELTYDFRFFATHPNSSPLSTSYTIWGSGEPSIGILQTSGADIGFLNRESTVSITGLKPDRFGQIFVDVEPVGAHDSFLGIMEITVVPEPSSGLLMALAAAALIRVGPAFPKSSAAQFVCRIAS